MKIAESTRRTTEYHASDVVKKDTTIYLIDWYGYRENSTMLSSHAIFNSIKGAFCATKGNRSRVESSSGKVFIIYDEWG